MTAKIVILDAGLLSSQRCLKSIKIAEIKVPAWPIPIHQTKLVISPTTYRPVDSSYCAPSYGPEYAKESMGHYS